MNKRMLEALSVDTFFLTDGQPEPLGTVMGAEGRDTTLDGYLTQFCTEGGSPCH